MKKFIKEMKKVLKEKHKKYHDGWKHCSLKFLFNSLDAQFIKLNDRTISNKETQRILIHIANYSHFLFERLKERGD